MLLQLSCENCTRVYMRALIYERDTCFGHANVSRTIHAILMNGKYIHLHRLHRGRCLLRMSWRVESSVRKNEKLIPSQQSAAISIGRIAKYLVLTRCVHSIN